MSEEDDNILTFSELRKTQKKENREEELTELDDKFLLRVSNYFSNKKEAEGESREYKNARRVLDKIVSLREEKIVKEARLAVRTGSKSKGLALLPEEQELFRDLKSMFESHRSRVEDTVESTTAVMNRSSGTEETGTDIDLEESSEEDSGVTDTEKRSGEENNNEQEEAEDVREESEEDSEEVEDGYKIVKTTSDVPEFMGTDLEAYGPFDEGEEIKIPDDNAEILVNRGNAELVKE